jgi:hypothetical protein
VDSPSGRWTRGGELKPRSTKALEAAVLEAETKVQGVKVLFE